MTASESDAGGPGRGKSLEWRSRSCKGTAPTTGRDAGSESGRDIGRNIANWWTSAVEQTSTFLMDEVPATFAGLSVGAKELKPALQRGGAFSSFTLGWKMNGENSKAETPNPQADVVPESSKSELPKVSPRLRLERSLERSHSKKLMGKAQSPSLSLAMPLVKSPHRTKNLANKVLDSSLSSLKELDHVDKVQEPSVLLPKVPKEQEKSPHGQIENVHEPSPKSLKWLPLAATTNGESKVPATGLMPNEVSPGKKAAVPAVKSPLSSTKSPLSASQIPAHSSPRKFIRSSPRKSSKHVEKSSLGTPRHSPSKAMNHVEKSSISTPKTPIVPSESSPVIVTTDPRSSARLGESRRRTRRMPVDVATSELDATPAKAASLSTVSQEVLLGERITPGSACVHSLESLQRQRIWTPPKARTDSPVKSNQGSSIKRVDGSGLGSSKRSFSSRSLARSLHFEETMKHLSPQLTAVGTPDSCDRVVVQPHKNGVFLPRVEIFPGKTKSLPQIRVRTPSIVETSGDLSKNPLFGGSMRVPQRIDPPQSRLSESLPPSPRYVAGETRTTRLLRKLKFTGRGSRAGLDDSKLGKRKVSTKPGKAMTDFGPTESSDLHREFPDIIEPRKLDFSYRNWTDPNLGETMLRELEMTMNSRSHHESAADVKAEISEIHVVESSSGSSEASQKPGKKQQGVLSSEASAKKNAAWPWSFKWKWGSKSRSKAAKGAVKTCSVSQQQRPGPSDRRPDEFASPTADIMSDAGDMFVSQSERFSSRGSADKLGSDGAPKHRRVLSWGATSSLCSGSDPGMTAFTPSQPRLPTRDAQELLLPPRKLLVPPSVNVLRRSQEQVALPEGRRSNPAKLLRGSADSDIFEDAFGSFRSTDSPSKGYGSFKSIESPTVSGSSISKTTGLSINDGEWDGQISPSFRQEIHAAAGCSEDPCTSTSHFVFKCPKVLEFNKFLRAQKDRLRSGLDAGNTDRFCIVLTGSDLELSSIVAAMSYAWLQDNSVPSVSGDDTWHPVPMIDIPRQQMDKHKDAAWLFDACGIDAESLLFADEVELSSLVGAGRIKMSIIGQDVLVTRNEVGSVCTLLVETLLGGHRGLLQPRYMKAFMLAGILLDTENLDFASMRDTAMSNILVEGMGCFGRTNFFDRLREADEDEKVSKLITQNYTDNHPSARSKRAETEHEHSDKESFFTQSQEHTSTSEAGTNSSLEEDSPRPKLRQRSSFKYSRLPPHSAPAKSHRLSLPGGCMDQDAQAVAQIRKAATQSGHPSSALPTYNPSHHREKSSALTRIRKNLFFVS